MHWNRNWTSQFKYITRLLLAKTFCTIEQFLCHIISLLLVDKKIYLLYYFFTT